jgi:hypothetical protein
MKAWVGARVCAGLFGLGVLLALGGCSHQLRCDASLRPINPQTAAPVARERGP